MPAMSMYSGQDNVLYYLAAGHPPSDIEKARNGKCMNNAFVSFKSAFRFLIFGFIFKNNQ